MTACDALKELCRLGKRYAKTTGLTPAEACRSVTKAVKGRDPCPTCYSRSECFPEEFTERKYG